jgi:hypothetical protein
MSGAHQGVVDIYYHLLPTPMRVLLAQIDVLSGYKRAEGGKPTVHPRTLDTLKKTGYEYLNDLKASKNPERG